MAHSIIDEFIQALDEEIQAVKSGKGGRVVKVFNGHFLRKVSNLYVYAFYLENFLAVLDDTPAEIEINKNRYPAQVLLTKELQIEIGVEQFCGKFILEAYLHTNLWYLLELLKKNFTEYRSGSLSANFTLSEFLFSSNHSPVTQVSEEQPKYSLSDKPPNEEQIQAILSSFSNKLCIIWGPPGTGKTSTIAKAVEAHLNANRRVLLVSHANNAVDEALQDIAEHLKVTPFYQEGKLVRLGKPQEEHLKKMQQECPLVLLEEITAKLGESLTKEKQSLENEIIQIGEHLLEYQDILVAIETIETLESELKNLILSKSECEKQSKSIQSLLDQMRDSQKQNIARLAEAQNSGALKRFFKGLDPKQIQLSMDKTNVQIDAQTRLRTEINSRLESIISLIQKKKEEIEAKSHAINSTLKKAQMSKNEIQRKIKDIRDRKNILLSRIAEITRQLGEIQKKIMIEAKLVATTLTKTFSAKEFPEKPFDVLILDEASMAPLPFLYWSIGRCREFVTIVGDFLQLPPICIAEKEGMAGKWLGRSIFEVLGISRVKAALKDPRIKLLKTQYRMSPKISEIPNSFFYEKQLNDHPDTLKNEFKDEISENSLVLIETQDMNPWCSKLSSGSRFNLYSALVCATLAKRMMKRIEDLRRDPKNVNARIGIITPYAPQARLIYKIAKDWGMLDYVRVSTVHRFQGGEEPVMIFDTVEGPGTKIAPMLDDSRNPDARLLLNVAISRAKSKLYLVSNTEYLMSQLDPNSSLARILDHFNEKADILKSDQFVDNYFTTDFEKWAEQLLAVPEPLEKQPNREFFTEKNFYEKFHQDLKSVKERLIILCPFLSVRRSGPYINFFQALKEQGVDIRIYTKPASHQIGEMANQAEIVIEQLRKIGVIVFERRKLHQKTVIIDNSLAWDGSLNILSHKDTEEHMWRFEGATAIEEIIRNLELEEESAAGNISDEKCPVCGKPMIFRRSKYGRFLSCSDYPRCTGKRDIGRSKDSKAQKTCPECGGPMVIRRSAKGAFYGCSGYPLCKKTARL